MPVFVVSLFLPYTVDFHDLPTPDRRPDLGRNLSKTDYFGDVDVPATLFPDEVAKAPKTPGTNAALGEFFTQIQPSAATHFVKPHDPRTLVRSDSHVPEWGRGIFFNHPQSKAQELPPSRILGYPGPQQQPQQQTQQLLAPGKAHPKSRVPRNRSAMGTRSSSGSKERAPWGSEWTIEPAEQGNGGLTNAIKAAQREGSVEDIIWVGTLGFPTDSLDDSIKEDIRDKLESEFDALPVFLSDSDFDGHYVHYCKTILWPVFHYQIPDHPKSKAYEDHSWIYYVKLNQVFADKIVESYKRNDIIWIHDYHLLLVPGMVRKKLPDAKIGFFLHTAFPSSEVFRCLSVRKDLLEGMLGADLIAFQAHEYQEHFLTTCSRVLIVEANEKGVQLEDRFVNVMSLPIGIDPTGLLSAQAEPEVEEWVSVMRDRYKGKKLIVARDKLDQVRGVRQKLLAFELFLNKYPEYKDNVVLIQVATSATDNHQLTDVVSEIVNRIESVHTTLTHQPLVFLRQDISFSQYLALLSIADILMVTSLREGMNLTCHEFIICQDSEVSGQKHGPVILSEFTGSSAVFGGADLSVNPWDYQKCAAAIKQALDMSHGEKEERYSKLHKAVMERSGEKWCQELIEELEKAHAEHQQRDSTAVPRLSVAQLKEKYRKSKRRVFFLDYEGTLASFSSPNNVHLSSPQRVLDTLNEILLDERNKVYIMSGQMPEELERLFQRVIGVGLIAENGCFVRRCNNDSWHAFAEMEKMTAWKDSVKGILTYYQERLEGSHVSERHCSIIFQYEHAEDQELASRLAGDCANHIHDACSQQRIHAVPLEKAVLIEPIDWTKGSAATHIFDELRKEGTDNAPDFLFVAGNDREDEVVFRWANKLGQSGVVKDVTTVSLGKRNTDATATLTQGTNGLISALQRLIR